MIIFSEHLKMQSSISRDLIYEPGCGIANVGKIIYLIDFDINKCIEKKSNLFTLLQMVVMREKNIPVSFVNEIISSDKNGFAIMMNYLIKENLYFLNVGGRIRNKEFSEEFKCKPDADDKSIIKDIIKSLDQKMKDGKLYKYTE